KTEAATAQTGRAVATDRRPAVASDDVPTAAPIHPERAGCRACRIHDRPTRIDAMPVLHPFPDIAMHVIEAPGIRLLLPHRMGLLPGVAVMPGMPPQIAGVVTKAVGCARPGPRRILPLGFCGQTVEGHAALARVQPLDELLDILPGDLFHRPALITRKLAG